MSKKFISHFKSPGKALSFWLNFKFMLLLFTGLALLSFSVSNNLNLLKIDSSLIAESIDFSYQNAGMEFQEIKAIIAINVTKLVLLTFAALVVASISKNHQFIAFLQAIFLICTIGINLFINYFFAYSIAMLDFVILLLIGSICACIVSLFDHFFLKFTKFSFLSCLQEQIKKKAKFKTSLKNNSPKQFLLSYLLFVSYSSLLNWGLLFYHTVEHISEIDNKIMWFGFLVSVWVFLAFKYVSLSLNEKIEKPILIPLVPFILAGVYIGPLLKIFFSSWGHFSLSNNKLYSILLALGNPTHVVFQNLQGALKETSATTTFAAFSSNEAVVAVVLQTADTASSFVKDIFQTDVINKAKTTLDSSARALEKLNEVTENPEIKAVTSEVLTKIYSLGNKGLPLETQTELLNSANCDLLVLANRIRICKDTLGSPRSGLVRQHDLKNCFESAIVSEMATSQAASASLSPSSPASAVAKVIANLIDS